jgi:hypothetical protein
MIGQQESDTGRDRAGLFSFFLRPTITRLK